MQRLRVHIDPDPMKTIIELDGKPVEGAVGIYISADALQPPRVTIEYGCYDLLDVTGHPVEVHHLCPLGDRR